MRAKWLVVQEPFAGDGPLIIKDVGGPDSRSVTNDAEHVVNTLVSEGRLSPGQRLLYYDSGGLLDEILLTDDVQFGGFRTLKPGEREELEG